MLDTYTHDIKREALLKIGSDILPLTTVWGLRRTFSRGNIEPKSLITIHGLQKDTWLSLTQGEYSIFDQEAEKIHVIASIGSEIEYLTYKGRFN